MCLYDRSLSMSISHDGPVEALSNLRGVSTLTLQITRDAGILKSSCSSRRISHVHCKVSGSRRILPPDRSYRYVVRFLQHGTMENRIRIIVSCVLNLDASLEALTTSRNGICPMSSMGPGNGHEQRVEAWNNVADIHSSSRFYSDSSTASTE